MSLDRSSPADRETERIVRSWLSEGMTRLPDRVLDAVLDDVPSTPQRRAWWPAWRFDSMPNAMRVAIATLAVLAVAVIALYALPGSRSGLGSPDAATPTPTLVPSPSAAPASPSAPTSTASGPDIPGEIPEGPFEVQTLEPTHGVQVDVPRGWTFIGEMPIRGGPEEMPGPPAFSGLRSRDQQSILSFQIPERPGGHPCDPIAYYPEADFGPSVADFTDHIVTLPGLDVVAPVPVTLGGYQGTYLELTVTQDIACEPKDYYLWQGRVLQGLDERDRIWILDVDGTRLVVDAQVLAGATAADIAGLQSLVDTIRITTASPSATP